MKIVYLDTPEENSVIDEVLKEKPVILAGSGVSIFKSSSTNGMGLPSGGEFTNSMFDYLLPSSFADNSDLRNLLETQWRNVVFENLMENCPDHHKIRMIIKTVFGKAKPNPVHDQIANLLTKDYISGIITTNYDQCFDDVFNKYNLKRVVTKHDYSQTNSLYEKVYFKIHGSIDDIDGETLVFALRHEGLLEPWKRDLLTEMVNGKSLLIVGYSGYDFEICPELLNLGVKTVFWNSRGDKYQDQKFINKLSPNARKFLTTKDGFFLAGDISLLLEALTNRKVVLEHGKNSTEFYDFIKKEFNNAEVGIWRASLLNTFGCASLAFKASKEVLSMLPDKENERKARLQFARSLYNLGKYKSSAKEYRLIIEQFHLETMDRISILNELANSYKVYGSIYGIIVTNRRIKQISQGNDEYIAWTMIRCWRLVYMIVEFLHIVPLKEYIKKIVEKLYPKAAKYALGIGNWFEFQALKQWIERMGIDSSIISSGLPYAPPSHDDGYEHLASFGGKSMVFRDRLCSLKKPFSVDLKNEFEENLECCKSFGLYPEVWKLCCINLKRNICMNRLDTLKLLCTSFSKCEYSWYMKICCLFHAIFHL